MSDDRWSHAPVWYEHDLAADREVVKQAIEDWKLTRRESQTLIELLRDGGTHRQLAKSLGVQCETASHHVRQILRKSGAPTMARLIVHLARGPIRG